MTARRPLLADVAAAAGVSAASVSLVLRGAPGPSAQTRRRVLDAATALGYRPDRRASALARRRSGLLGVSLDIRNPFHADLVEHLDTVAAEAGLDLVLTTATARRSVDAAVEALLDFGCEALVLLGTDSPVDAAEAGGELSAQRIGALADALPLVVVGRRLDPLVADVVRADDQDGVGRAVDHLAQLGHRRIWFVDGGAGTIAADRRAGYRVAMSRAGLGRHARVLPGDHTEGGGQRAARALLATRDRPSAVVTSNDRSALGLLDTLARAHVPVPAVMSVVGYDDSPPARWAHVELTSVNQDAREQARCAVRAVLERFDGPGRPPRDAVLPPRLVVRATTGPPPER